MVLLPGAQLYQTPRPSDIASRVWPRALRFRSRAPGYRRGDGALEARDLAELMACMRDLIGRVRAGRFRSSEIADPTITVTSLGDRGAEAVWGVIYPPQVAIVGFGAIATRPWLIDGMIAPRPLVCVTLAGDHRVSDGHRGSLFLARIGAPLAEPGLL